MHMLLLTQLRRLTNDVLMGYLSWTPSQRFFLTAKITRGLTPETGSEVFFFLFQAQDTLPFSVSGSSQCEAISPYSLSCAELISETWQKGFKTR